MKCIGPTPLRRPHTSRFVMNDSFSTTSVPKFEEHEAVLLSRTIQMLSQKEDIRSSLAHAQICRDAAEERRERCVQTLRSMNTRVSHDQVFELKEEIDAADAEIEYNDVAIAKARSKLKRLSAIRVQDLISNLTENEARACAFVCAREVLDLRKSAERTSERMLELELILKEERNRSSQLEEAMKHRDCVNRIHMSQIQKLRRDNTFYRQTHRELKRKIRSLSTTSQHHHQQTNNKRLEVVDSLDVVVDVK